MPFLIVALIWLVFPQGLLAQGGLGPVDRVELSPYDLQRIVPGVVAPDFRLQDQDGKAHQLSHDRDKNVVLVMYRGYW